MKECDHVWDVQRLKRVLDHNTERSPLGMEPRELVSWALDLSVVCERLADASRRRANELESAYWQQAEEAMFVRRPRVGLKPRSRAPLNEDEMRRARINAGTMLGKDPRFKDACNANEMYDRWAIKYANIATAAAAKVEAYRVGQSETKF